MQLASTIHRSCIDSAMNRIRHVQMSNVAEILSMESLISVPRSPRLLPGQAVLGPTYSLLDPANAEIHSQDINS